MKRKLFYSKRLIALAIALALLPQAASAALTVVQSVTVNAGTSSRSPAATFGTTPANGDLIVAVVQAASITSTWATPAGWTGIQTSPGATGCWGQAGYYQVSAGASATYTLTNTLAATAVWAVEMLDIAGPASGAAAINTHNSGSTCASSGSLTTNGTTSTTTGALLIVAAVDDGTGTAIASPNGFPFSPILGVASFSTGHAAAYDYLFTHGGSGVLKTLWGSAVTDGRAFSVVVAPAATPAPPTGLPMMGCCK